MKVLVTAGSTKVPIDKVRVISNIFRGRTGTEIAKKFSEKGCDVTLITSSPDLAEPRGSMKIIPYRYYQDLSEAMKLEIKFGGYDVVVHSAAVSDYEVEGMFVEVDGKLMELDKTKKISSQHKNLFMKMRPTDKIIDQIRKSWKYNGVLVKFKLEVGLSEDKLTEIAVKSKEASKADIIVANCLEWARESALIINGKYKYEVSRTILPTMLYKHINECMEERKNLI